LEIIKIRITTIKNLIFDLGFFNGEDSLNYIKKGFRVVAVEANPILYEKYKRKFKKYIDSKTLVLINKIFTNSPKDRYFFYNPNELFRGSVKKRLACSVGFSKKMFNIIYPKKIVKCKLSTINLKKLVNEYGTPYYIKFDMDGVEKDFINNFLKLRSFPKHVSVEFDKVHSNSFLKMFKKVGYKKFLFVNQIYNTSNDSFFHL